MRILLRGAPLAAGPVTAAQVEGSRAGLEPKTLVLGAVRHTLALDACDANGRCAWVLRRGAIGQRIAELGVLEEASPRTEAAPTGLIWAGDIDRDGKLDLIVDVSDHYNAVANVVVLLSSRAAKDDLVGIAGSFRAVGC